MLVCVAITVIVMILPTFFQLREDAAEFKDGDKISAIIKKYSNFVGFPITVNGARVNTVQPLWTMKPSDVTEEQHECQ